MIPEEKKSVKEEKVEQLYRATYEFWYGDNTIERDNEYHELRHKLSEGISARYWDIIEEMVIAAVRLGKSVDTVFCILDILGIDYKN